MADARTEPHPQTDVAASDIVSSGGFGWFHRSERGREDHVISLCSGHKYLVEKGRWKAGPGDMPDLPRASCCCVCNGFAPTPRMRNAPLRDLNSITPLYKPGDHIILCVRHPIWNGIECRLIEKHEDTGQWKMENVHGNKYTVYYYEDDFFAEQGGYGIRQPISKNDSRTHQVSKEPAPGHRPRVGAAL